MVFWGCSTKLFSEVWVIACIVREVCISLHEEVWGGSESGWISWWLRSKLDFLNIKGSPKTWPDTLTVSTLYQPMMHEACKIGYGVFGKIVLSMVEGIIRVICDDDADMPVSGPLQTITAMWKIWSSLKWTRWQIVVLAYGGRGCSNLSVGVPSGVQNSINSIFALTS